MSTAPWDPSCEQLIRSPLRHKFTVTVKNASGVVLPLDVTSASVTLDEFWSPYVQGTLTAPVPSDQALLDELDPRRLVHVDVDAGYLLPGTSTDDVHPLARMYLAGRDVARPGDQLSLAVQGEEYLRDRVVTAWNDPDWAGAEWDSGTPAAAMLHNCLYAAGAVSNPTPGDEPNWAYSQAPTDTDLVEPGEPWVPGTGDEPMSIARDIADRAESWFRCDELGMWRATPRPQISGATVHQLQVGANGTITGARTGMSRDGWANHAVGHFRWNDSSGIEQNRVGEAASGGAYAPSVVGKASDYVMWDRPGSYSAATRTARSRLARLSTRGRSMDLDAVAAYWVRPGHTVTVQLPLGGQERHLVSAVTFDLTTGGMRVVTRLPEG